MVILVCFMIHCASGMVAGARVFKNLFGLPCPTALWMGAACTIAYGFIGGFLAVSWTDTIQVLAHPEGAAAVSAKSETVFIELAKQVCNPWSAGLLLAAILAAVMSTLSCQLLVCASALTEDIYRTFVRKNAGQSERVWVGRAMVMAIALVAIGIARNPEAKVLCMVSHAWAGFSAAFGPVIILSLFCPHDAQLRSGGQSGGRGDSGGVEAERVARPVRDRSGLYARLACRCGRQPHGPALCRHAAKTRCGASGVALLAGLRRADRLLRRALRSNRGGARGSPQVVFY